MHRHLTREAAQRCSRFCFRVTSDRMYFERHGHLPEYPREGCGPCSDDEKRAQDERKVTRGLR